MQEEEGDFEFTQDMVDTGLDGKVSQRFSVPPPCKSHSVYMKYLTGRKTPCQIAIFSGEIAPFSPALPTFFLSHVRCLCTADANKSLVIQSPRLMTLLMEALLLDPRCAMHFLKYHARYGFRGMNQLFLPPQPPAAAARQRG
jgi:hypothetical protein